MLRTLVAAGPGDGTAKVYLPGPSNYPATPSATLTPFPGFAGTTPTAAGDVNGDGFEDTVFVTGPGGPIRVAVLSGADNSTFLVPAFDPFGGDFVGGGFVAAADVDGDGKADVVVTPDQGGGPRVSIFSFAGVGVAPTLEVNFFGIDDPNVRGGARAAVGDVHGDGVPDLVVAAGFGGGPRVAIFDGTTLVGTPGKLVGDFFAFPGSDAETLRNGAFVAVGGVDGDGKTDPIFGGGPGGSPRVFILCGASIAAGDVSGAYAAPLANFFVAGNEADRGGVRLAAKDADGDGRADVTAGSGEGSPSRVRVYFGSSIRPGGEPSGSQDLDPFGGAVLPGGMYVG